MALAERAQELLHGLPRGWQQARLELTVDEPEADRAAADPRPAAPGRTANRFVLNVYAGREQLGTSPDVARRVLARLDREGIRGRLQVVATDGDQPAEAAPEYAPTVDGRAEAEAPRSLAASWRALVDTLPPDWSHCLCRDRAGLLGLPRACGIAVGARESARRMRGRRSCGSGQRAWLATGSRRGWRGAASSGWTQRRSRVGSPFCGSCRRTRPVGTQGPVWRIGGQSL